MDQLHRPRSFPDPRSQYTLKDMTVVWHLYGGRDFGVEEARRQPDRVPHPHRKSALGHWSRSNRVGGFASSLRTGGAQRAPRRPRAKSRHGRLATLSHTGRSSCPRKPSEAPPSRSLTALTVRRLTARLLGCDRRAAKLLPPSWVIRVVCSCVRLFRRCPLL